MAQPGRVAVQRPPRIAAQAAHLHWQRAESPGSAGGRWVDGENYARLCVGPALSARQALAAQQSKAGQVPLSDLQADQADPGLAPQAWRVGHTDPAALDAVPAASAQG